MDLAITAGLFDGTDHRPWCSSNLHFGGSFVQMVSSYDHDPIVICFREPGGFFFQNYSLGTAYKRSFGRVFVVGNDILHWYKWLLETCVFGGIRYGGNFMTLGDWTVDMLTWPGGVQFLIQGWYKVKGSFGSWLCRMTLNMRYWGNESSQEWLVKPSEKNRSRSIRNKEKSCGEILWMFPSTSVDASEIRRNAPVEGKVVYSMFIPSFATGFLWPSKRCCFSLRKFWTIRGSFSKCLCNWGKGQHPEFSACYVVVHHYHDLSHLTNRGRMKIVWFASFFSESQEWLYSVNLT